MSGNFAIKGGGVGRLMANAILNFHFDFPHPSLIGHAAHSCPLSRVHKDHNTGKIISSFLMLIQLKFRHTQQKII